MPGLVRPGADEREELLAYLSQQRYFIRISGFGLTDDQAKKTPTAGKLSIGGIIKHVASVERDWMDTILQRTRPADHDYEAGFRLAEGETLDGILRRYDDVASETAAIIGGISDLEQPVPVPKGVPWFPDDVEAWTVRWVLLHLIEETARHSGHADIIREALDSATAYPLMAAVEGWPAAPYIQPWKPSD